MKRLEGKIAIVTGAARGTGAEVAHLFVDQGAKVVLADLNDEQGEAVATALGRNAVFRHADVSVAEDWQQLVETARKHFGPPDVLVNNAAQLHIASLQESSAALFERLIRTNQLGPFLGMKAVLPDMLAGACGSIVNIGSCDGVVAQDIGLVCYGATKWALRGMTKMAALELGRYGIRVNCVNPDSGSVEMSTPFLPAGTDPAEAMQSHIHQILAPPPGVVGHHRLAEIANMALFLASDESAGCTGGDFPVDGGYSAGRRFT